MTTVTLASGWLEMLTSATASDFYHNQRAGFRRNASSEGKTRNISAGRSYVIRVIWAKYVARTGKKKKMYDTKKQHLLLDYSSIRNTAETGIWTGSIGSCVGFYNIQGTRNVMIACLTVLLRMFSESMRMF